MTPTELALNLFAQTRYISVEGVLAPLLAAAEGRGRSAEDCVSTGPKSEKKVVATVGSSSTDSDTIAPAHMWAAMSHEIRTPLTGILGTLEVLASTSLTDEQRRMIATAERSSADLMRIVNDVLDLARLESTTVDLELKQTNVAELMEDCAEFLANQADAKGLVLTCETDSQIPDVICDPVRLRQILTNLLGNAIKFTDAGRVALSVSLAEMTESRANIRFLVEDTGIGIPEDLKKFLFQPFSQIKDTGDRGTAGVGLGLAICRHLVEAMGGVIRAESKSGRGALFIVELPLDISRAEPRIAAGAERPEEGITVIAVKSEEPALQIAMSYLRDAGIGVTVVNSMSAISGPEYGLLSARPPVVMVGPDAEQVEIEAISDALQKMQLQARPVILWLHPRAVGGALSLVRRGIKILRAYPLRRTSLIDAVLKAQHFASEGNEMLTFMRRFQTEGLGAYAPDDEPSSGEVILIVEDNPVNQQVLRQQLAILGMPCDVAGNGNVALQMMEERDYALLLCDCHMPGMDGLELTRIIREREKHTGAHVTIIAVTANALPGEAERCKAAGMDDYLAKPIEIKNLRVAMERWIQMPPRANTFPVDGARSEIADFSSKSIHTAEADLAGDQSLEDSAVDLKNLQILYGEDHVRLGAVLGQWTRVISEAIEELRSALKNNQKDHAIEAVHRLKGSAGIAGAHKLSVKAAVLEKALRGNDTHRSEIASAQVLSIAKKSLDDVEDWKTKRLSDIEDQAAS